MESLVVTAVVKPMPMRGPLSVPVYAKGTIRAASTNVAAAQATSGMTVHPRGSFMAQLAVAVSLVAHSRARGRARGRCFICRALTGASQEVDDDKMHAGMLDLLGLTENMIAEKLVNVCPVDAVELESCVNDAELKSKKIAEKLIDACQVEEDMKSCLDAELKSKLSLEKLTDAHGKQIEPENEFAHAADETTQTQVKIAAMESEVSQMMKISAEMEQPETSVASVTAPQPEQSQTKVVASVAAPPREQVETDVVASAATPPLPARGKLFRFFRRLFGK